MLYHLASYHLLSLCYTDRFHVSHPSTHLSHLPSPSLWLAQMPLGLGNIDLHGLPCPAVPGPVAFGVDLTLPSIAPPGDYDIYLTGTEGTSRPADDVADATALCLDVKLKL